MAALTRSIVFIVLVGICLYGFTAAMSIAGKTIDNMVDFSLASLPALVASWQLRKRCFFGGFASIGGFWINFSGA